MQRYWRNAQDVFYVGNKFQKFLASPNPCYIICEEKNLAVSYTNRYICNVKFKPRSETTRQFIIETTADIFNTKGYAGTSMSDIAEATHLTKGSIYGNFENKEAVALAVFDYNLAFVNKRLKDKIEAAGTSKEKLMAYVTAYSSPANSIIFQTGGCPLLNTGIEADDTHDPLRKKVASALLQWKKNIMQIIEQGITAKEFKPDLDIDREALSMIALIQGGVFLAKTFHSENALDIVMQTLKYMIEGLTLK